MDTFARNALRLSLAVAGLVVLGAGYVGQASADERPDPGGTADTADTADTAGAPDTTDTADTADAPDTTGSASPLPSVPTVPAPEYLLASSSLDTFILPTATDPRPGT